MISPGEHTGCPSPFRIWWKTRNSSIRPEQLYPERPCNFMAEIPAWANHCDPCCGLEMQWMCWRPDYPRKKPRWPLYWSLILSSGGSEHSLGRTERDWFTLTPAELVQTPGKAGFSGSWGKEKLICLPRWDHPSYCNFIFENTALAWSLFWGFQAVPGQPWSTRKVGQPVPWCRDLRMGLSPGLAAE